MTRTYGTSCMPCRLSKIKCTTTRANAGSCDRCAKSGKQCSFEPRRQVLRDNEADTPSTSNASITQFDHRPAQHAGDSSTMATLIAKHGRPDPSSQRVKEPSNTARDRSKTFSHMSGFTPPSFVEHSGDARNLSLNTILNPESLGDSPGKDRAASTPGSAHTTRRHDPIHLGLLSQLSAQHLFHGYFTYFECFVGSLDPKQYTFDYTRQRSSFLFTVIMSISARVFRPELAPTLRNHVEGLLGHILLSCDAAIENILAIVLMYYWKEQNDNRGYILIGYAIRLAAASDWHGGRRRAYTGYNEIAGAETKEITEMEARELRNQDRVWLLLNSVDRAVSFYTNRPLAGNRIAPDLSSRTWLRTNNPWTYPFGDARTLAGNELTGIAKPVHDYICLTNREQNSQDSPEDLSKLYHAVQKLNDDVTAWCDYWVPVFATYETSSQAVLAQTYLFPYHLQTYFNSILVHRVLKSTDNCVTTDRAIHAIQTCYTTAMSVLRQGLKFGQHEHLYFLWDGAHLMVAYAAMVVHKLLLHASSCPGVSISEAYSLLEDVAETNSSAARLISAGTRDLTNSEEIPPAVSTVEAQARFLRAVVFRLREITPHGFNRDHVRYPEDCLGSAQLQGSASASYNTAEAAKPSGQWNETQEIAEIADAMDLSLDTSFVDAWFTQAGLLPWDEPGMFRESR